MDRKKPEMGLEKIKELIKAIDEQIPLTARDLDRPFLMTIEDTFLIHRHSTVLTGSIK